MRDLGTSDDMKSEGRDAVGIRPRCGRKRQLGSCCDTVIAEEDGERGGEAV